MPGKTAAVRVSHQDYGRDLRAFNLALSMLRHGARLHTVCAWTGFTEDRIRNLARSHRRRDLPHRGPSPNTVAPLLATGSLRSEVAALTGLCRVQGVIPEPPLPNARRRLPSVALGEQLCEAYEFFQEAVPYARINLEQLIFLVLAVAEGRLCSLDLCPRCRSVILIDHLSLARRICVHCQKSEGEESHHTRADTDVALGERAQPPLAPGHQHRLFD